ncbi:MAG: hypothetical protein M0Q91_16430 [Methanoregula sp.]|jgi:hypothetical protein|nr:hypothetical protein [Methanoregula sp.]
MEDENNTPCTNMYGFPAMKTRQDCQDMLDQFFPPEIYKLSGNNQNTSFEISCYWRGNAKRAFSGINWSVCYIDIVEICNDYVSVVYGIPRASPECLEGGRDLGIAFSQ